MTDQNTFEKIFKDFGYNDFRWIDAKNIEIAQWVRMKCMFGCPSYGKSASCPPNVPSVAECRELMAEYQTAVIFHFQKQCGPDESVVAWTNQINKELIEVEKAVFFQGYPKTFLMAVDECSICAECTGHRETCKQTKLSRPTAEALAIDVFSTVRKAGYDIQVLTKKSDMMNRFAILLVE